jgi:hypothetical protein
VCYLGVTLFLFERGAGSDQFQLLWQMVFTIPIERSGKMEEGKDGNSLATV